MTTIRALTEEQLREVEAELLRERARLERALASETETTGSTELSALALRTPVVTDGGLALALETRTHARYGAILGALTRLAAGTYAVCVSCSNRIPYGRLIVMPEAARCVACGSRA